jgi:hypothetical protein
VVAQRVKEEVVKVILLFTTVIAKENALERVVGKSAVGSKVKGRRGKVKERAGKERKGKESGKDGEGREGGEEKAARVAQGGSLAESQGQEGGVEEEDLRRGVAKVLGGVRHQAEGLELHDQAEGLAQLHDQAHGRRLGRAQLKGRLVVRRLGQPLVRLLGLPLGLPLGQLRAHHHQGPLPGLHLVHLQERRQDGESCKVNLLTVRLVS